MKKLSLVLMMVFAASWVMAQNNALINQTGGAGNTAFTNQNNSGNDLLINQYISGSTGTNTAGTAVTPILQNGSNNEAKLVQQVNGPLIVPSNEAKIQQIGNGNYLVGATANANNFVVSANAEQIAKDYTNFLDVLQQGNGNIVGLSQNSNGRNEFGENVVGGNVQQVGDNNVLVVKQTAIAWGNTNRVYGSSEQIGSGNVARAFQYNNTGENYVILKQNGNSNYLVDADANGYILAGASTQTADGTGNGNTLNVTQTGGTNIAGVHQITPAGFNSAIINQNGGDHASVFQTGAGNNVANVIQ
jgi:hypothetical protein